MTTQSLPNTQSHAPRWPFSTSDPYDDYRAAREDKGPVSWDNELKAWLVLSYNDARHALAGPDWSSDPRLNPEVWERLGGNEPGGEMLTKNLLLTDPPEHARLRSAVGRWFTPRKVEGLRPRIAQLCEHALSPSSPGEELEVMDQIARPLPLAMICELLDIDAETAEAVWTETPALVATLDPLAGPDEQQRAAAAAMSLMFALTPLVAERRASPGDDLLSDLVGVLGPDEAIVMTLLLLAAGHETTSNLIGNTLLALAQHPAQLEQIRRDPQLVAAAIEETLRWDGPVQVVQRIAKRETELGGQRIKVGDQVLIFPGAANRDPAVWPEPDRFDIHRLTTPTLSFGHGPHFCIGAALARAEATEVITQFIGRGWRPTSDFQRPPTRTFRRVSRLNLCGA